MTNRTVSCITALALVIAVAGCGGRSDEPDAGSLADTGPAPRDAAVVADAGPPVDAGPAAFDPVFEAITGTPPTDPAGRWGAWMVHAEAAGKLFLFGGSTYPVGAQRDDAWVYDLAGQSWSPLTATGPAPAARYCLCATYLPDHGQILWVGGRAGGPLPPAAWTLDVATSAWSEVTEGTIPPGVVGCQAAWYPPAGYALVFGGDGTAGLQSRSFAYRPDERRFDLLNLPERPPGRRDAMMAYDPGTQQVFLHGGTSRITPTGTTHYDDTYVFDGTQWSPFATTNNPPGRRWGVFAIDAPRGQFVLWSGTQEDFDPEPLWTLNLETGAWTQQDNLQLPPARGGASHAYVAAEDAIYIFGGLQQPDFRALDDGWRLRLAR